MVQGFRVQCTNGIAADTFQCFVCGGIFHTRKEINIKHGEAVCNKCNHWVDSISNKSEEEIQAEIDHDTTTKNS